MKDPAFLFYSSDFLTGVSDLTFEERGQYITLLCIHHQKGRLTQKIIDIAVPNATADVMAKFQKDDQGLFFNARLEAEKDKRAQHAEKQRQRALKGWEKRKKENTTRYATADATALPLENEIENENKDRIEYPYTSKEFLNKWKDWKAHRKAFDKFKYTPQSEKAALTKLKKLAKSEARAIAIIDQSIEKGWKGFFPLKQEDEPKTNVLPSPEDVLKVFPGVLKSFHAE